MAYAKIFQQRNKVLDKINVTNFHPLEVVGRGSETQLQMNENLNKYPSV